MTVIRDTGPRDLRRYALPDGQLACLSAIRAVGGKIRPDSPTTRGPRARSRRVPTGSAAAPNPRTPGPAVDSDLLGDVDGGTTARWLFDVSGGKLRAGPHRRCRRLCRRPDDAEGGAEWTLSGCIRPVQGVSHAGDQASATIIMEVRGWCCSGGAGCAGCPGRLGRWPGQGCGVCRASAVTYRSPW